MISCLRFAHYVPAKYLPHGHGLWDSCAFVYALKGWGIPGGSQVINLFGQRHTVDNSNLDDSIDWFADVAAGTIARGIRAEDTPSQFTLVAVPGHTHVAGEFDVSRTMQMATAVSARVGGANAADLLWWDEEMTPAVKGGPRHASDLFPHLELDGSVDGSPYIIVDDVTTGGGHIAACAAKIEEAGGDVWCAVVAGQTGYSLHEPPFAERWLQFWRYAPP